MNQPPQQFLKIIFNTHLYVVTLVLNDVSPITVNAVRDFSGMFYLELFGVSLQNPCRDIHFENNLL